MKKTKYIWSIALVMISIPSLGQNLHFSQFYLPDYTINPALTGRFHEDIRVNLIHRAQWYNTGSNIATSGFGYDMNFEGGKLGDSKLGVGISFLNDVLIADFLEDKKFSIATAYHIPLDGLKRSNLSFGVQGTLAQLNISGPENYLWGSEFDQFNRAQQLTNDAVGEDFSGGRKSTISVNIGTVFSHKLSKKVSFDISTAAFNVNKPNSSVYGSITKSDTTRLNWAYVNMLKVQYSVSDRFMLQPAIYYINHTNAQNTVVGTLFTLIPNPSNQYLKFSVGSWYRLGASRNQKLANALILSSLIELHNFKIGMSYDFNISDLNQITNVSTVPASKIGTLEISLTYLGQLLRSNPNDITVPCKFF